MKYMIVNKTDLNREDVGKIMDQIIRDSIIDTQYYGKVNKYEMDIYGGITWKKY